MIYSIFPSKDATLYEQNGAMNSGIDEILELTKIVSASNTPNIFNTRIAIDFDTTDISASVASGEIASPLGESPKFYLKVFNVSQDQVPYEYTLAAMPISESWSMGLGRSTNDPVTKNGVSWVYKDDYVIGNEWRSAGGSTYTSSEFVIAQTFNNTSGDINMDVTSIITGSWSGGSISNLNNGILITRSGSQETDGIRYGSLKYFSNETHTIYPPRLEVKWDDSSFNTGSLTALDSDNITISNTNLQSEYSEHAKVRVKLLARELYPTKTYTTASVSASPKYIPSSSYYSIIDASTDEIIIPFDTLYTKISVDINGNYFNLWMNSLLPERLYKIGIRVDHRQYTNQQEYFTCPTLFKVNR
jgi:hypothetical protein